MLKVIFLNILTVFGWLTLALWSAALLWTFYCLKKQKPLKPVKSENADKANKPQPDTFVSILVPARNEAFRVLDKSIASIIDQSYDNFEVIVLNDRSTDATKKILEEYKSQSSKIKIIDGAELPKGWLGKPYALQQALQRANGEWIITTDADIIFAPETLLTAVRYAEENNFDALTLAPKLILHSFWEILFMPVFGWFCILAMPFHRVNNPDRAESMGVGNFFMFRRKVLNKIGGFESVKSQVAEDLKLAEIIKKQQFKLRIDYAPELIETRMYAGFWEIWEGFTKNLFSGMKFSLPKTIFGIISVFLFGVIPFLLILVALVFGQLMLFLLLFFVYIIQTLIFAFLHLEWRGNLLYALLTPFGLFIFLSILVNSTVKVLSGRGVTWKGRVIYGEGGVPPPRV
ncbi:MAG: glycosyltransferase family 2 protein [Pyrinomonadaceae bacterium]